MKKVLFGLLLLISFGAFASDVTYSIASAHDRTTKMNGAIGQITVKDGGFKYALQSLDIGTNRTTASAAYEIDVWGLRASAGLGVVDQRGVVTHPVYFGAVGYTYNFSDKFAALVDVGYKNDFQHNVQDHEMTYGAGVSYALFKKTSFGLGVSRSYGDTNLNAVALNVNTKF